eukprot:6208907-Pleurochrysis_carterae.AAC.2
MHKGEVGRAAACEYLGGVGARRTFPERVCACVKRARAWVCGARRLACSTSRRRLSRARASRSRLPTSPPSCTSRRGRICMHE